MTRSVKAVEPIVKHPSDAQTYVLGFKHILAGRTVASVNSIAATSGLTVGSAAVVSSEVTDDNTGEPIAANEAVQYAASGGTAGTDYDVTITVTLSDGSVVAGIQTFEVRTS